MTETKKALPQISIMCGAILWGIIGLFVRNLSAAGFTSMQMVAMRTYITATVLIIYLAVTDRQKLKINIKDIGYFIGTGIISFSIFNFCYFTTIKLTSMAAASILLYTAPIMVMIMSVILFKEEINAVKTVSLILAVIGCGLICGVDSKGLTIGGFFTGLCSGFCYALYSIFARYALKKYNSITVTVYTFIFASVGVIPFVDFGNMFSIISVNYKLIAEIIAFGIISSTLPYALYTRGLTYTDSGKASVMATLEPAVATLTGIFVFGESIGIWGIAGIILVFGSVIMLSIKKINLNPKTYSATKR